MNVETHALRSDEVGSGILVKPGSHLAAALARARRRCQCEWAVAGARKVLFPESEKPQPPSEPGARDSAAGTAALALRPARPAAAPSRRQSAPKPRSGRFQVRPELQLAPFRAWRWRSQRSGSSSTLAESSWLNNQVPLVAGSTLGGQTGGSPPRHKLIVGLLLAGNERAWNGWNIVFSRFKGDTTCQLSVSRMTS